VVCGVAVSVCFSSELRGRVLRSMKRAGSALRFWPAPDGRLLSGVALLDMWNLRGVCVGPKGDLGVFVPASWLRGLLCARFS